ncbi:MAG: hypothetical protein P8J87_13350 [Verrucomicrobiales bacterium]|nr:hypothetical protein [Verrucomicrobiales bacterium]
MVPVCGGWAQAEGVEGTIDLSKFPADLFEEVIVPVPSEVFEVLDKLGQPNWRAEMRDQNNVNLTDRYEVALQFGVVVADGFIAVQAQDRQMIQNMGQEVRRLAQQLGLKDPVLKHAQSIMDSAERNDYDAVRLELDKTQRTVREEMEKMRDGELAQCVSIGGWLRGTEVVTALISKSFSAEKSELLNQPDLVAHFEKEIERMKDNVRRGAKMKKVAKGLKTIGKAMRPSGDGMIQADAVASINSTCAELVKLVAGGANS